MFGKEPAIFFNGIGEIIRAIIPAMILFGFIQWTDQQIAAIMLVVSVVLGFLITMLTRSNTVSTVVADKQIEVALKAPSTTSPDTVIKQAAKEA